ncbi:MAG TPA: sterol desaturase family protein [Reyranella sp.]|nr:sterol desaturase family protein [Reyranella sp.]
MDDLKGIYLYLLPVVIVAAIAEGVALSAKGRGFDWKSWACSLADLAVRQVLSRFHFMLAAPVFVLAYQHRLFTLHLDSVTNVALLFVGLEFFYYWFHRSSHTVRYFWNSHSVHHSPNQLNLAAAYRLGWMGRATGATVFFTPLAFLGFEPGSVLAALTLNLTYQFWIHAEWIPKLGWLEYVLNTPSAHRVHHARNVEYLDANYGGVLIVFDRLFGTYVEERADVPCDFGLISTPRSSYNPFANNFKPWIGLVKDLVSARSLHEVWMYLFAPPGWRPDGHGLTTAELRRAHAAMT